MTLKPVAFSQSMPHPVRMAYILRAENHVHLTLMINAGHFSSCINLFSILRRVSDLSRGSSVLRAKKNRLAIKILMTVQLSL